MNMPKGRAKAKAPEEMSDAELLAALDTYRSRVKAACRKKRLKSALTVLADLCVPAKIEARDRGLITPSDLIAQGG